VAEPDWKVLRDAISRGDADLTVVLLEPAAIDEITWSGSPAHLEHVRHELERVRTGEVVYLVVRADGRAVSKGGVDFAKEPCAGTIYQVATRPDLEGLGLATRLFEELEHHTVERGCRRIRLGVEREEHRTRRLYEHLGYRSIGESEASWEAERPDGSRYIYTTTLVELEKLV
jgi:ribosomal protein S18 acetylase RimI-like enzyme